MNVNTVDALIWDSIANVVRAARDLGRARGAGRRATLGDLWDAVGRGIRPRS